MLVIEDGSIVAGANSYVSRADYITYAATLGIVIADTVAADAQLIEAGIFIGSHEPQLKGVKITRDSSMAYPRSGLVIDGWSWLSTEIPRNVILSQMALALDINAGGDLYNVTDEKFVTEQSVEGAVSRSFAAPSRVEKLSTKSKSTALLNSLLKNSGLFSIPLLRA